MMNGIDRWHTMKEAHGVHGFVDEKSSKREVGDLSDRVITSEGCAKEVVFSHLHRDTDNVRNDVDYACPHDALRSTSAVSEHDVSVPRVIIT